MIYQLLIAFIIIATTFYGIINFYSKGNKIDSLYFLPLLLILALILGCRGVSVGVDTYNYKYLFQDIANDNISNLCSSFYYEHAEIGYVLFNKFFSIFINDYNFFQLCIAFIHIFTFYQLIKHYKANRIIASVVFLTTCYIFAFNLMRQSIAIDICLFSFIQYRKRKFFKSSILFLTSILFHTSAFIFIINFILYEIRHNTKYIKLSPLIILFLSISLKPIVLYFGNLFPKYNDYIDNTKDAQSANMVLYLWIIELIISLIIIYKRKSNAHNIFIALTSLIYIQFNILGLSFNYLERISFYFAPFIIILFCDFYQLIKNRYIRSLYFLGLYFGFLYYFYLATNAKELKYIFF